MMWSTHPPDALPKVGDTVATTNSGIPLIVTRRSKNKVGQVFILAKDPIGKEHLLMVEVLNWWPQPGDICTGLPEPCRKWLADGDKSRYDYQDYNNGQSWIYGEFKVKAIDREMATVSGDMGTRKIPVECLTVVTRPTIAKIIQEFEKGNG